MGIHYYENMFSPLFASLLHLFIYPFTFLSSWNSRIFPEAERTTNTKGAAWKRVLMAHFLKLFPPNHLALKDLVGLSGSLRSNKAVLSLTRSNSMGSSPNDKWAPSTQQKDNGASGSWLSHRSASSLSSKKCLQNNCPKCWMRPLVASLYSAKWI